MKINSSLAKKLKAYSALAGVVAVAPMAVNAQIIYTNVEPDTLVNTGGGVYALDLNGDGVMDFRVDLEHYVQTSSGYVTSSSWSASITPAIGNYIAGDSYSFISVLAKGDSISPNSKWITGSNSLFSFANLSGNGYLGLNLLIKNQIHYGWARIKVSSDKDYFIVQDYAYNSIPDQMILAGETSCKDSSPVPEIKITGDTLRAIGLGDIQWCLNGNIIPGYSSNALSPPAQGVYSVIFSDTLGCSIQSLPFNFVKCDSIQSTISSLSDSESCIYLYSNMIFNNPKIGFAYQWQKNLVDIPGATNVSFSETISASADYRLVVFVPAFGCKDTSNTVHYTVYPRPPSPTVSQHGDTLLSTKAVTYQWYKFNTLLAGETNQIYIPVQSGYYQVGIKDSNGCYSNYGSYSFDICYYLDTPVIVSKGKTVFCRGTLMVDTLITSDNPDYVFQWNKNEKVISGATSNFFTVSDSGIYKVKITDLNNCSRVSNAIDVHFVGSPHPKIFQQQDTLYSNVGIVDYQWLLAGQPISGATDFFYIIKESGYYSLEATNEVGCKGISDEQWYIVTDVKNVFGNSITLRLLLLNRKLFLSNISQDFIGGELQLFDSYGRILNQQKILSSSEEINLSSMSDGLYLIEIRNKGYIEKHKFIFIQPD